MSGFTSDLGPAVVMGRERGDHDSGDESGQSRDEGKYLHSSWPTWKEREGSRKWGERRGAKREPLREVTETVPTL